MTIQEIITKYGLEFGVRNGVEVALIRRPFDIRNKIGVAPIDNEFINVNRPEIIRVLKAEKESKELIEIEKEKAYKKLEENSICFMKEKAYKKLEENSICFMVVGYESHEVRVDLRKEIEPQLVEIYEYYKTDLSSLSSVRESYEKAIKEKSERIQNEKEKNADRIAIFDKAKTTGIKQQLQKYTTQCNSKNEDCSMDIVTEYAMPDGTTTKTRVHTW